MLLLVLLSNECAKVRYVKAESPRPRDPLPSEKGTSPGSSFFRKRLFCSFGPSRNTQCARHPKSRPVFSFHIVTGTCENGFKFEHRCFAIISNGTRSQLVPHFKSDKPSTSSATAHRHARPKFRIDLIMMLCSNRPEGFVRIKADLHS